MAKESIPVLYVARHGTTTLNSKGCFRGSANPPLDQQGISDAHRLATLLAQHDFSFIVTSDRTRAVQTANIIAKAHDDIVHQSTNLRAFNVGEFSGKPRDKENTDKFQQYIDNPDMVIPDGESLNQFKARVRPCIMEALEMADDSGKPGLLVAHSSIVHEVGDLLYGDHKQVLVEPGGVIVVFYKDEQLHAQPIFKPIKNLAPNRADTIS